jgi:hypothetical protein
MYIPTSNKLKEYLQRVTVAMVSFVNMPIEKEGNAILTLDLTQYAYWLLSRRTELLKHTTGSTVEGVMARRAP